MPVLRTAEILPTPARTVAGVVSDGSAVLEVLRRNGFRPAANLLDEGHPSLLPDTVLALRVAWPRCAAVLRSAVCSVALTGRAGGALLTVTLDTVFAGGAAGDAVASALLRRRIVAVLAEVHAAVAARARTLACAPVVVAAAIVAGDRVLAQRRAYPAEVAGRWELPGGRVEQGETDQQALVRECAEELGVPVLVGDRVGPDLPTAGGLALRAYAATVADDTEPHALDHAEVRWLATAELDTVDWLDADTPLLPALRTLLTPPTAPPPPGNNPT